MLCRVPGPASRLRIAVVGDCHCQWDEHDVECLDALDPDLAMFVGNFGDESAAVVHWIAKAAARRPTASIFGNRDFLWTARKWRGHHPLSWYRKHGAAKLPEIRERPLFREESLEHMHKLLDESDVGYRVRDYASLGLSVVGGRPFSNGGRSRGGARNLYKSKFYRFHYGVRSLEQSSRRIVDASRDARFGHSTVVLAHHGPDGLGDAPSDPCGCDWDETRRPLDWGDPDLAMALREAQALPGVRVPLVVFGHADTAASRRAESISPKCTYVALDDCLLAAQHSAGVCVKLLRVLPLSKTPPAGGPRARALVPSVRST